MACCSIISAFRTDGKGGMLGPDDKTPFHVRGISWFGTETQDFVVNGLWSHPMDFYMDILEHNGFNALRIPFSAEWVNFHWDLYPYEGLIAADPEHHHRMSRDILHSLIQKCKDRGIYVMLDLHRLVKEHQAALWYSQTDRVFTSEVFLKTWLTMLDEYGHYDNLMALDLFNEPHDPATWGSGDMSTDWRLAAEDTISKIARKYTNASWVYLVEGINWGKYVGGAIQHPIRMPEGLGDRLVYSTHEYGASVVPSVDVHNVAALRADWDNNFGRLRRTGAAVWTGEFGGRVDVDREWMVHYVDYLRDINATDTFFWSLTPNSGDVRGMLQDDYTAVDEFKMKIMKSLG